jgi:hypothetical protein
VPSGSPGLPEGDNDRAVRSKASSAERWQSLSPVASRVIFGAQ